MDDNSVTAKQGTTIIFLCLIVFLAMPSCSRLSQSVLEEEVLTTIQIDPKKTGTFANTSLEITSEMYGQDIAVDSFGNVYSTGIVLDDLGEPRVDTYLMKHSDSGIIEWFKLVGTSRGTMLQITSRTGLAVDSWDNLYIVGNQLGNLDDEFNAGSSDVFLAKYNPAGEKQWTRLLGSANSEVGFNVAIDTTDNVLITGQTNGPLGNQETLGGSDAFVSKFDSAGNLLWTRIMGGSNSDTGYGVATDDANNVYVTGQTYGIPDQQRHGMADIFIIKYTPLGDKAWTRVIGSNWIDKSYDVAADAENNIYVTGTMGGKIDGTKGSFVYSYNQQGTLRWKQYFKSSETDGPDTQSIAIDNSGNLFLTGSSKDDWEEHLSLDKQVASYQRGDIVVIKLNSGGKKQWTKLFGTAGKMDFGRGVTTDNLGNVYVTGLYGGDLERTSTVAKPMDYFLVRFGPSGFQR